MGGGDLLGDFVDFLAADDFNVVDFGGRPRRGLRGVIRDVVFCFLVGIIDLDWATGAITDTFRGFLNCDSRI